MKKTILLTITISTVICFFIWKFYSIHLDQEIVARVGDLNILRKDVEYRNQIIPIYYPNDKRRLGLLQLTNAYTAVQILKNNGYTITDEMIAKESQRIDSSTRMPEMLQKIKNIFENDSEAYLKIFVLPVYAERIIYFDFFLHHPNLQKESLQVAKTFLQKALHSKISFKSLAEKSGFKVIPLKLSLNELTQLGVDKENLNLPPDEFDNSRSQPGSSQDNSETLNKVKEKLQHAQIEHNKEWIEQIIKKLKPGQIFPYVIDDKEGWVVIRYVRPEKQNQYLLESVGFPKADYGNWLNQEKSKVIIDIRDKSLD